LNVGASDFVPNRDECTEARALGDEGDERRSGCKDEEAGIARGDFRAYGKTCSIAA